MTAHEGTAHEGTPAGAPFPWGRRTCVVGIVNASPDSFSGDGLPDAAAAVALGLRLADEGADLLDVGGASTRPGAAPVDPDEERRRVLPVVRALAARTALPLSVDTTSAAVAREALAAGATVINDVSALAADPLLAGAVRRAGATVVLMDNRLTAPGVAPTWQAPRVPPGEDIVAAVGVHLSARVAAARRAGIAPGRIVVDPGLGFGKTTAQSLALLRHLALLGRHPGLAGLPLLVGPSRKGFIGRVLDLPVAERLEGTLAAVALAVAGGAAAVRVHDVRATVRCCRVADAVVRGQIPVGGQDGG